MIDHPIARAARWVLALAAWVILSIRVDTGVGGAEQAGYVFGSLLIPLVVAAIIRVIYVKLRRTRRFLSPWLFYLAAIIGLLARVAEYSSNAS